MAVEEGLLPEDHARQHTAQAPHIQTVVIHLKHTYTSVKKSTDWMKAEKSNFPDMQLHEIQPDIV